MTKDERIQQAKYMDLKIVRGFSDVVADKTARVRKIDGIWVLEIHTSIVEDPSQEMLVSIKRHVRSAIMLDKNPESEEKFWDMLTKDQQNQIDSTIVGYRYVI